MLSIVIVSFNTRDITLKCLEALYEDLSAAQGALSADVWVVDNASSDGSAAAIRAQFPRVRLVENRTNRGFGAANNQAFRLAAGCRFLLLNSDALVRAGTCVTLVHCLGRHPASGVVGPRLLNADLSLQRSCFPFPTTAQAWLENVWVSRLLARLRLRDDYERWPHDCEKEVDWVVGACMMVRREVLDAVGGFDEQFFMYAEETDWQRRIRDAGWQVVFTPAASVVHLGGASGENEAAKISRSFFSSLDRYVLKHHGRLGLFSMRLAMVIGSVARLVLWSAAYLAPKRRVLARRKLRLMTWLVARQIAHPFPAPPPGGS
jgi:N-acetylglucosaminyl-diphospho-decaprenol L-rhamnosyltransferase